MATARRSPRQAWWAWTIAAACILLAPAASAQDTATAAAPASDPAVLEELVGPVALYPDDLLSIVLPASTFPLHIVEAQRWVEANKGKNDAKPPDKWDDSVKALINYPEVITLMNNDLDWTSALGEAVIADETAVMDAVQSFRRKADGAGNLKSDDKMTVATEEEVIKIVQADPQVIYVPQYEPTTVVVQQAAPVYPTYYPTAYPCYYCYYPPGYAFASGFFWGAAAAWAFNWHGGGIHNNIDIDIDRNRNVNRNTNINNRATNIDRGKAQQMGQNKQGNWQANRASTGAGGRTPQANTRMGDRGATGAGNRATAGTANRGQAGASTRPAGGGAQSRPSAGTSQARGSGAASRPSSTGYNRSGSNYGSGGYGSSRSGSSYGGSSRYGNASSYSGASRGGSGYSHGGSRSAGAYSSRGSMSRGSMGGGGMRGGGGRRR